MKLIRIPFTLIMIGLLTLTTSCDILNQVVSTVDQPGGKLTTEQVAQGLKEALKVGTDAAVRKLNATDGYFLDQIVKIRKHRS
jgi:hypothetical protein